MATWREQQADELALLESMYPSEFSYLSTGHDLPLSPDREDTRIALAFHPSYTLKIIITTTYPEYAKPTAYVSFGDDVDKITREEARTVVGNTINELELDFPCLDLVVQGFKDWLDNHLAEEQKEREAKDLASAMEAKLKIDEEEREREAKALASAVETKSKVSTIKRSVIWSHHLLATSKRKDIVEWSRELRLGGYSRAGYPGAILVEGDEDAVDEFVHRLKQLRWQALQVRAEEIVDKRYFGTGGVTEVEALGDIVRALQKGDQGLADIFLEGMKISTSGRSADMRL